MASVDTQSTMSLKALSPMPIKDSSLFPLENGDDDAMSDDSFHLRVSDDEEEERIEEKNEDNPVSEKIEADLLPTESEDDILNRVINNIDGADEPSIETPPLGQIDEDKLLSDGDEVENVSKSVSDAPIQEESKLDSSEPDVNETKDAKTDESETKTNSETSESNECADSVVTDPDLNNSVSDDKKDCADSVENKDEKTSDESEKSEDVAANATNPEEDQVKQEQVNAELLKNQIMDTEDLLQIVDKETDENDKETDENDKDSSGGNSPRSVDKGDSDELMEGEETETEKVDTESSEKMDEEEEEEHQKSIGKDEDAVDIDESNSLKAESDAELDKVYKSLAAGEETAKIQDPINKEIEMETSTCEDNTETTKDTIVEIETNGDSTNAKAPLSIENEESDIAKQQSSEDNAKASPDSDATVKTSKRSLSESDVVTSAKKIKLQTAEEATKSLENTEDQNKDKEVVVERAATPPRPPTPVKIIALNAIDEYLKIKSLKKLKYRDLEQIVLQKICEAICHKSEIGELRHQLGVQEQMIEMWRKESAQLNKQARDLEIVNKRLLHEVRLKNERDKPLIPVKITRSVGLQVRSDANMINNVMTPKRRVIRPQINPQSTIAPAKQNRFNAANRASVMNKISTANRITPVNKITTTNRITTTNKVITPNKTYPAASPTKKVMSPKTPNSLLSKALQNSVAGVGPVPPLTPTNASSNGTPPLTPITTPTLTAITLPTATSTTTANKTVTNVSTKSGGKSVAEPKVIDLTDEDDKKTASTNSTQGVRIVSAPVKTVVTTAGVVNPPRIMYVYNNQLHQGVLAADPSKPGAQKLMLKLNSNVIGQANGVLTAVSNGSAITVGNAALRAGQVQPVRLASPLTPLRNNAMPAKTVLRHPAPLPPPPANQLCLPSRKPVPPKPHLSIKRSNGGLILSWKMPYNLENFEAIASYQLYAYQETTSPPSSEMWRKVGDVKALALPMACTLTQFADGNKYHFAVRAVDVQKRMGPFSDPEQILL